jgi:hypothetical protein
MFTGFRFRRFAGSLSTRLRLILPLAAWVLVLLIATALGGAHFFAQSSPSSARTPQDLDLSMIVVPTPEEAQQILERLKSGEDFRALATERSIDPTASAGGSLGKVDLSGMRPELRDALKGVGPDQVTPVVRIPEGYAILKVIAPARSKEAVGYANSSQIVNTSPPGSVIYGPDISGFGEALAALSRFPKAAGWDQDLHATCEYRKQSTADFVERLKFILDAANPEARAGRSDAQIAQAYYTLAQMYAYQGEMDAAIEQYKRAWQIAAAGVPEAAPRLEEALGTAYLHRSEMINGVYRSPGARCLFPMRPNERYQVTADSEEAVRYFLDALQHSPGDLELRWLLNLAYATLGKYPSGVPKPFLIPPSAFASGEDVGRFVDVAPQAGLVQFSMAGGNIVDDFEGKGLLDVVTSSSGECDPMHFFHNNGDGTFTDRAAQAGLSDQLGGLNMVQTDYNNDGCLDILVLRGGWQLPVRRSLLRNNCNGTFTDVTSASGLAQPATSTQTAVWADINNDGFLDLFLGRENRPAQLFLNQGDGTFKDISHSAGVDRIAFTKGVAAGDYDNDGYMDLYVSNLDGDNFLYHNNRNNTFTEVAKEAGVPGNGHGFATWFFDYDNDGWPDIFVTSFFPSVDESLRTYLNLPHNATTLKLYRNLGNGHFRDVTAEVGLDKVLMPMGANYGDIDNDGFLDIYLGTGNPSYAALVPNALLRNDEGKRFVDVTASSGTGELHKGHGVAFADIDRDGDEDLLEEEGGAVPGDRHAYRLFENPGNGNDWINLKLVGVKSNRAAVGARIQVTVTNDGGRPRSIYRTVSSGGSFGASPLEQHIGLGKSARILRIEIWWPASNTRQTFTNVARNQFLEVREFAPDYTRLVRTSFRLGGPGRDAEARRDRPAASR